MVAVGVCGVAGDAAGAHEFGEGLFHGQHAVGASGFDVGSELMIVAAADEVSDAGGRDEDFDGGITADAVCGGDKLL